MMQRVGVIGGGQLAWMMAPGAAQLQITLVVQTPKPDDPAVRVVPNPVLAPVADAQATAALAARCQVITFENEFIDLPGLQQLAAQGIQFYPQLSCLEPILDKYTQRQYCQRLGLPSPRFTTLESVADIDRLPAVVAEVGLPFALKTRRHGYDGQGTFIIKTLAEAASVWEQLGYQPILLEAFVPFVQELAVMVARDQMGSVAVYPVVASEQIDQVCRRVIAPAIVSTTVRDKVRAIATQLITALDYIGVLGIELFLTDDGQVLINEIAPRTHNSGHYTLDACRTSQFEQQLRAVAGHPLGDPEMICPRAIMVNLLGYETASTLDNPEYTGKLAALSALPDAHLYWYGKSDSRPGRKLGHVTVLIQDATVGASDISAIIRAVEGCWYPASSSVD
ncbi:MAG: 5-(carboxyamino)imidazole ribonucleotide synthase [Cyanobacteria bacterium J06632_22]